MSCGVICRREIDDMPWPERFIRWDEPKPRPTWSELDWAGKVDRILVGFIVVLCLINIPVAITAALLVEFVI